jgi:hypothetical protein
MVKTFAEIEIIELFKTFSSIKEIPKKREISIEDFKYLNACRKRNVFEFATDYQMMETRMKEKYQMLKENRQPKKI